MDDLNAVGCAGSDFFIAVSILGSASFFCGEYDGDSLEFFSIHTSFQFKLVGRFIIIDRPGQLGTLIRGSALKTGNRCLWRGGSNGGISGCKRAAWVSDGDCGIQQQGYDKAVKVCFHFLGFDGDSMGPQEYRISVLKFTEEEDLVEFLTTPTRIFP